MTIHVRLLAIAIMLVGLFLSQESQGQTNRFNVLSGRPEVALMENPRLQAIAKEPGVLHKLDQRRSLANQNDIDDLLSKSYALPHKLFPRTFESVDSTNAIQSICLTDNSIYFSRALGSTDILAVVPIRSSARSIFDQLFTIWLCAPEGRIASLRQIEDQKSGVRTNLQAFLAQELGSSILLNHDATNKNDIYEYQGALAGDKMERNVTVRLGQHMICIEVMFRSSDVADGFLPSPVVIEPSLEQKVPIPISMPTNWPPK